LDWNIYAVEYEITPGIRPELAVDDVEWPGDR
jgi:hypothetical protein